MKTLMGAAVIAAMVTFGGPAAVAATAATPQAKLQTAASPNTFVTFIYVLLGIHGITRQRGAACSKQAASRDADPV